MIKIKEAQKEDIEDIAKLSLEYSKYENRLNKEIEIKTLNEIKNLDKKWMDLGTRYLLAKDEDKLIAFLSFTIDKSGNEKVGNIHTTIVSEDSRGKGLGKRLFKSAKQIMKKERCKRIKTFIHKKNKNAFNFWRKQGFETEEGFLGTMKL